MTRADQALCDVLEGHMHGREQLVATLRGAYSEYVAQIFNDNLSDEVFFEPRAFAWLASGDLSLTVAQLLCGEFKSAGLVKSDEDGVIFLSRRGYLRTAMPLTTYDLILAGRGRPTLLFQGRPVSCEFIPCTWIPKTKIELVDRSDEVLRAFFAKYIDANVPLEVVEPSRTDLDLATQALELIRECSSTFYNSLSHSLRAILLFRHSSCNSFAALGLHGMICLNVRSPPTLGFYVDGYLHQGGHIVFSEATLNRQAFFRLDPDSPSGEVVGDDDGRSIYEVLHGLFTEYVVLDVMNRIVQQEAVTGQNKLELRGRMALTLRNMSKDLERAEAYHQRILSENGKRLLRVFECGQKAFFAECQTSDLDLSGQFDEFNQVKFVSQNWREA